MLLRFELGYLLSLLVLFLTGPALAGTPSAPVHEKPKQRLKHWMVGGAGPDLKGGAAPEINGSTAPEMGGATAPEMGGATGPGLGGGLAPEIGGVAAPFNWQDAGSSSEGIKKTGLAANFLCSPQENSRAMKADVLGRQGLTVNELCIMGMTKFGWACLLTLVSMVVLVLCVPLILAVSRRRPPGTSLISTCGSKPPLQFRPPTTVPSYSSMNPGTGPSYASTPSQTLLTQAIDDPQAVLSKPIDFVDAASSKPVYNIDDDIRFP